MAPLPILLMFYFILNHKNILHYELYILLVYYALTLSPLWGGLMPHILFGRMLLGMFIILALTACKTIAKTNYYGLLFLLLIFIYRLITLTDPKIMHELMYVGKGNYLNILYSPFTILLLYEKPEYW